MLLLLPVNNAVLPSDLSGSTQLMLCIALVIIIIVFFLQTKFSFRQVFCKENRRSPNFEDGEVEKMRANYAGNVRLIDDRIDEILQTVQRLPDLRLHQGNEER